MKKGFTLAFVYIGLVIGAGFASGREIMTYFNIPSGTDHSGIVLAAFLFMGVAYLILCRAAEDNLESYEEYLTAVAGKMATPIRWFMVLYLFCGFVTMLSGSGALFAESYMLPPVAGGLLLAVVCFLVLGFDLKGIVAANGIMVPCMVVGICYLCLSAAWFGTESAFSLFGVGNGVVTSALCYVSYNTLSAPAVLVPLQKGVSKQGIRLAAVGGGFVLGLLILVIWAGQNLFFDALWESQLPMLKLAAMTGRMQRELYTWVLAMAIGTTAISQGFGLLQSVPLLKEQNRWLASGVLCLLAIPFSWVDFSYLVSHLYGFFGTAGLLWMGWLLVEYLLRRSRGQRKKVEK